MITDYWTDSFRELHTVAVDRYRQGLRGADTLFDPSQTEFLASIGLRPIFLYDHAEDLCGGGNPTFETTLLIAAARRDYFLVEQSSVWTEEPFAAETLPARTDELAGIPWLPRILQKARGCLLGNLPPNIMFNCGGDRQFLSRHHCHPADFLRAVWASRDDDQKAVNYLHNLKACNL